jgi:hypothetical protein
MQNVPRHEAKPFKAALIEVRLAEAVAAFKAQARKLQPGEQRDELMQRSAR